MNTKNGECWSSDHSARAIRFELGAGHAFLLPFEQFLYAELMGGTELRAVFAHHEVRIRGKSLRRIETALQRLELSHVACLRPAEEYLVPEGQPVVRGILIIEQDPKPEVPKAGGDDQIEND